MWTALKILSSVFGVSAILMGLTLIVRPTAHPENRPLDRVIGGMGVALGLFFLWLLR